MDAVRPSLKKQDEEDEDLFTECVSPEMDVGKKLTQPNLDESFGIKSDEYVFSLALAVVLRADLHAYAIHCGPGGTEMFRAIVNIPMKM